MWAEDVTVTWNISGVANSANNQQVNTALSTSSITPSGASGTWTAVSDGTNSYAASSTGAQLGASSGREFNGTVSLSNTSIPSSAIIKSVSVTITANGTSTLSATVGGNSLGSNKSVTGTTATYTIEGSQTGNNIVLTFSNTQTNKYIKITQISVTYTATTVDVTGVSLPSTAVVGVGKTITLTPTFTPSDATNKNVTWESKNTSIATVSSAGVVTGVAEGTVNIEVTTEDGEFNATCSVTVDDGSINLANTGSITFNTFNGEVLGTGGYKTQDCELKASNNNTYTWHETNGYYNNSGWQLKSGGSATSPNIKSANGFTISVTHSTGYNVTISDGTNNGTNSLTTTKTNTKITLQGSGGYTVISGITIIPTPTNPSDPVDNLDGTITLTTTANMAGWRAFYDATQDYTVDANTKIYVAAKSSTSNQVDLIPVAATAIPHGEAVILKTSDVGRNMTLTETTGAATLGANVLAVTDGSSNVDGYRLGYKDGTGVGFFKYTTTTAPAAGIVYIDKSNVNTGTGAPALSFVIVDDNQTTAIKTIATEQPTAPRKVLKNGRIIIETADGQFSLSGTRVK